MSLTQNEEIKEFLDPNTITLTKLLAENAQLIQTIAEYQRMGRIGEAGRYQELLHRNLMILSKEFDPSLMNDLEENAPTPKENTQPLMHPQPVSVGPSSVPPPSSSSAGATSVASPNRIPQQNGHLSPYGSHGPSPLMRNGHHTPQGYIPGGMPPQETPLPPQMPPHAPYGMANGYPYPPQAPYMNGLPSSTHMPPPR